jgi:hypothetical protein
MTGQLVTPEVIIARIKMYFEETCFAVTPNTFNGQSLEELAIELADVFESPFATHEDFLDPSEQELSRLHAIPSEIDEFIEQALANKELVYA